MAAQTGNTAPVLSDFEGQGAVYDGLMRTLHDGTFVHAYLITGLEGMGKRTLARLLAQYWLCQAPTVRPLMAHVAGKAAVRPVSS